MSLLLSSFLYLSTAWAPADDGPRLYDGIALGAETIVFSWAGDLWSVPRSGGEAERLTDTPTSETYPHLSPDGLTIAFTSDRTDLCVWTIPITGGTPRQLTHHPKADIVRGWTADGQRVLFASGRDGDGLLRLYTMGLEDHFPHDLALPQGTQAAFSPDGERLAYVPVMYPNETRHYRFYRGGLISAIWIVDLDSGEVDVLTEKDSNAHFPMWIGHELYFLSDRTGTFNLYAKDLRSRRTRALTRYDDLPIRWATAGPGGILFAQAGHLHLYDLESGSVRTVPVSIEPDLRERAPKNEPAGRWTTSVMPSGDGSLLALEVRGDIATFDPTQNLGQRLTESSSSAEREPVPSPDGRSIAYFSDASGEYTLEILPIEGGEARRIEIEDRPTFYRQIVWSPDSSRIVFSGKRLGLWLVDVESGEARTIARSDYLAQDVFDPVWSPDGRYLAYVLGQPNHVRRILLWDSETDTHHVVTEGRADTWSPAFDRNGRYLYFIASNRSVHTAANRIWGLLSAVRDAPTVVSTVHVALLRHDEPVPRLPFSAELHPEARPNEVVDSFRIDVEGIAQRLVKLPLAARDYGDLQAAGPGVFYVSYSKYSEAPGDMSSPATALSRYDVGTHRLDPVTEGVEDFTISADGKRLVTVGDGGWRWAYTSQADAGTQIALDALRVNVNLGEEWAQIYHEAWRLMRDFFYDPGHHGVDIEAVEAHYAAYLPNITRREDLDRLLAESLGHVSISHMSIRSGDEIRRPSGSARIGLLGADYEIDGDRYRITHVYRGGALTCMSSLAEVGPLAAPGMEVSEGDYVLAVQGRDLRASEQSIYEAFAGTAYRPTRVTIGRQADGSDGKEYLIVPVGGANTLRLVSWFEENRRHVEELSAGRIGYVYNYNYGPGLDEMTRDLLAACQDKDGLVIDQRFSPGGLTADFMIRLLQRDLIYRYDFPAGEDLTVPTSYLAGPKVLVINEHNGSAAETFPLMFEAAGVGTIVGKRTLGGGTGGALYYPRFIDGGRVTIPNRASYQPKAGYWLENRGVAPDVEVEIWPKDWRAGRDPQLETAVEVALEQIEEKPEPGQPPYPVHPGGGGSR